MKKQIILLVILTFVCAVSAFGVNLKVDVPFAFSVGNKTLSTGEYIITGTYGMVRIQGIKHHSNVFVLSDYTERTRIPKVTTKWTPEAVASPEAPGVAFKNGKSTSDEEYNVVVFRKYGDNYFLSKIWTGFLGREFREGDIERQLSRAGLVLEPETVVLVATVR